MTDIDRSLENILSPREIINQLKKHRLPVLRKLAEGKPIQSRTQKTFLLEQLADFYLRRNVDASHRELTEILYRAFEIPDIPSSHIDFFCGLTIEKTIMECIVIRMRSNTLVNMDYAIYTCDLVDRYMSTIHLENQSRSDRYSLYMGLIQESVDRVKYYIRKRIHSYIQQPEHMVDDIEYTDVDSDEEPDTDHGNAESIEISVLQLVCPPKLLKQHAQCPICMDPHPKKQMITTDCEHWFCYPCFSEFLKNADSGSRPSCPLCRTLIYQIATPTYEVYVNYWFSITSWEETPGDTPEESPAING